LTLTIQVIKIRILQTYGAFMPIYEYVCQDCGVKFDILRSIKDADAPITCQKCASLSTKRAISLFAAHSGGKIIAGNSSDGCAGCAGGTCASCGH
jgi:putative FmdB family regulatory protein